MDEMLRDLIKRGVKKVYLEVDEENKQAISLYEKLNFEKIDKRNFNINCNTFYNKW